MLIPLIVCALFTQTGCGYSLAGRGSFLPTYIKRVGIPQFTNATSIIDVERQITERVRSEFIGRGKYTVVPETTGVDAVLNGEIVAIALAPSAFDPQTSQATRMAVTLVAKVEFKDLKTNKVIWSNPSMQYREEFTTQGGGSAPDAGTFLDSNRNAMDRISTEFARALVSAILEAF